MRATRNSIYLFAVFIAGMLLVGANNCNAQGQTGVQIRKIDGKKLQTPEYKVKVTGGQSAKRRTWFQITTEYESKPEWIDELRFVYYVLVKGKREYKLFSDEVSYVNVEKGRTHDSVVYLHPSTLKRYGDVECVAVLIYQQGRLVASQSKPPKKQRWWEQRTPITGYILNRMQTPFAMINFDNYEAIKPASKR